MSADLDAAVAKVKPGDEVTATFRLAGYGKTHTVRGTIWRTAPGSLAVGREVVCLQNGVPGHYLIRLVINKPAPDPEPPIGSVVLDDDGDAWQCFWGGSGQLWRSTGIGKPWTWERLSDTCGPLRVVYTPEVTP